MTLNNLLNNFGIPSEFIIQASFYSIALLTCLFAILVVRCRNVFHSAIFLAATLIGVACVYLFLNAEFLAVVQVLIYVGAIVILFIFAIMLTAKIQDKSVKQTNQQVLASGIISLAILFSFIKIIRAAAWQWHAGQPAPLSLVELGRSLMTVYVLPFEVISLILLAALVGAIAIGKVKKE